MAITLDITEIKKILPHRFPMLLVDRILDLEPMKWAVGVKNITVGEIQFLGHAGRITDRSHGAGRRSSYVVSAGKPGQDCRICQD